jgi:hypothetical protein
MKSRAVILRWWLLAMLIGLGTVASYIGGIFELVNNADITKLSFLIYGLFVAYSVRTGIITYAARKKITKEQWVNLYHKNDSGWFVSDTLFTLGMIGTVLGFIFMLGISFKGINASNVTSMQSALSHMGTGMSTALYTTAAGLICSLLLKLQLFNLSQHLNKIENSIKCDCVKRDD